MLKKLFLIGKFSFPTFNLGTFLLCSPVEAVEEREEYIGEDKCAGQDSQCPLHNLQMPQWLIFICR